MLEQFKKKYLEEVNDLLNKLESTVLQLEQTPDDTDSVAEVFRVMHTIKGTSGMYEFKTVEKITHQIESVYGKIRDEHFLVSEEIVSITFEGIDLVRNLLNKPGKNDSKSIDAFLNKLSVIIDRKHEPEKISFNENNQETPDIATYHIVFSPDGDITGRGVNIKSTIEEASSLGRCSIIPRTTPEEEIQSGKFYMFWELILSTSRPYSDIEEVFMFVSDEVKICKIADSDLFSIKEFAIRIEQLQNTSEKIDLEELARFTNSYIPASQTVTINEKKPKFAQTATGEKPENHLFDEQRARNQIEDKISGEDKIISKNIEIIDQKTTSLKVDSDKLDELMNLVSELVTTKAEMLILADKYKISELHTICEKVDRLSNKFKDNALSIRLMPIESMMLRFERLVRDLSNELNKKIEFVTEGTDTELDKTIIDNLAIPLMHIIRNSIDHGIESPERRRELNKPETGIIKFTAFYSGSNVFIQVQDDGAGMNPELLKEKAIEKGFLKAGTLVTEKDLYDMVFLPGFSTAQKITGISGRGVGMDVVKQNIINLRGEIEMDSEVNLGTITTIKLPLTLSIVDALLVSVGNTLFLIPVYIIDCCTQEKTEIFDSETGRFPFENEIIPYVNLRRVLEIHGDVPECQNVIVVKYKDRRVGLVADKVIGEHQTVLKSLGRFFMDQEYISGASILGDGNIALILDTNKLIKQIE